MPGSPHISVRTAVSADWSAIWQIFGAVVAGANTYAYDADISEAKAKRVWMHVSDDATERCPMTYVAELAGDIVGTALLKPNLPGLGDHVANAGWMVDPSMTGQGIGRAFALAVMEQARQLGYESMQFNAVVSTNANAINLWTSLGFEIIGTIPAAFRHKANGPTDLHIMHRPL